MPNYGQGFSNTFNSLSDFFGYLMQQRVMSDERLKMQQALSASNWQQKLLESIVNKPEIAVRAQKLGMQGVGGLPIDLFAPSEQERTGEILGDMGKATSISQLATPQETIGRLKAADIDTTPGVERLSRPGEDGNLPSSTFGPASVGPTKDVLSALQARRQMLQTQRPTTQVQGYDPISSTNYSRFVPNDELSSLGQVQTSPSPEQAGQNKLGEAMEYELSPAFAVAKAQVENKVNELTLPSRVRAAGRIAGAETGARERASLAPDIVSGKVDLAGKVASAQARGAAEYNTGDRKVASQVVSLINNHGKAMEFEKGGARISPTALAQVTSPMISAGAEAIGMGLPEPVKQYLQAAVGFTNDYAYIRSGVTVRADEFPRYLTNFFALGTDTPDVIRQKQNARAAMTAAMQVGMGPGGKRAAGEALGRAIVSGQVNPSVINSLQMEAEFQDGLMSVLPVIGPDGRPLIRR